MHALSCFDGPQHPAPPPSRRVAQTRRAPKSIRAPRLQNGHRRSTVREHQQWRRPGAPQYPPSASRRCDARRYSSKSKPSACDEDSPIQRTMTISAMKSEICKALAHGVEKISITEGKRKWSRGTYSSVGERTLLSGKTFFSPSSLPPRIDIDRPFLDKNRRARP